MSGRRRCPRRIGSSTAILRRFQSRGGVRSPTTRRCGPAGECRGTCGRSHRDRASSSGRSPGSALFGASDAAVDYEMRDVDALRLQLACHALREPAQRELAHREGGRAGVALHACGSAGEQHGAVPIRQHALDSLLGDQERSEGRAASARSTAAGSSSTSGPRTRALGL